MQHDKNIENKLREMEAMEQPDLAQMDAHWQQMAGMLQPVVLPVKKGWPKWMLNGFYGAVVVLLIGISIWFVTSRKNESREETITGQNKYAPAVESAVNSAPAASAVPVNDKAVSAINTISHQPVINLSLIPDTARSDSNRIPESQDSILGTMKIKFTDCDNCPLKTNPVVLNDAQRRQLQLQRLFMQLGKEEQHFVIDNRRDTVLRFAEGTGLLVPANSFGGMNGAELSVKEFYKTSDIILNQLNTESNKDQLETGGMLQIEAGYKGSKLSIDAQKPLVLFMKDTSDNMKGMQLFNGNTYGPAPRLASSTGSGGYSKEDTASGNDQYYINWIAQGRYFTKNIVQTQMKVLNLVNEPYKTRETSKGTIAYFIMGEESTLERSQLKKMLKEKYGYYKVKLRADFRGPFINVKFPKWQFGKDASDFNYTVFNRSIGDSVWMDKATADKYNLAGTATRQIMTQGPTDKTMFGNVTVQFDEKGNRVKPKPDSLLQRYENFAEQSVKILDHIEDRYGVSITELGWINCDRFYSYNRKKIDFKVDLGDQASNYYTMLVFDNIRSMMTGAVNGNQVAFQNIPIGEPVKVISIGINKSGETVYSVTHTTTSEQELKGLQFQTTSVPDLKASLSKLDN